MGSQAKERIKENGLPGRENVLPGVFVGKVERCALDMNYVPSKPRVILSHLGATSPSLLACASFTVRFPFLFYSSDCNKYPNMQQTHFLSRYILELLLWSTAMNGKEEESNDKGRLDMTRRRQFPFHNS